MTDASADASSIGDSGTRCPGCDAPIAVVTGTGPHEFAAAPCGCRVSPETLGHTCDRNRSANE